jgi:phenylacetate-CoA ligase
MPTRPEIEAFLKALEETQYLSPPRLQAYQRRLLGRLLTHAQQETAFYAERLNPVLRADGSCDWDRWQDVPILTRSEAQENFAPLCARSLPPVAGGTQEDTSSGSTGRPLRHLTTDIQNLASGCASERFFNWHGIDPGSLTVRIRAASHPDRAYPKGRRTTGWRAGHLDSEAIDLSISTPVDQQVEWVERVRPRYLATYPSNLRELARHAARLGVALRLDSDHDLRRDDLGGHARRRRGILPYAAARSLWIERGRADLGDVSLFPEAPRDIGAGPSGGRR